MNFFLAQYELSGHDFVRNLKQLKNRNKNSCIIPCEKLLGVRKINDLTFKHFGNFLVSTDKKNEFDFEVTYGSKQTEHNRSCRRSDDDSGSIKRTLTNFSFLSHNENSL